MIECVSEFLKSREYFRPIKAQTLIRIIGPSGVITHQYEYEDHQQKRSPFAFITL
jgi:hypothetical protein